MKNICLQQVPLKSYMLTDAELHFAFKPVWPHFGFMFNLYAKPAKKCLLCCKPDFPSDRLSFRLPKQHTHVISTEDTTAISNNNKSTYNLKIRQATDTQSAPWP